METNYSEQAFRPDYEATKGLEHIQSGFRQYLETEKDITALYRLGIINYELGDLMRMIIYRRSFPTSSKCGSKEDLRVCIGDAMSNLIILSQILGISSAEALSESIDRLTNKEWRKHA